MTGYVIHPDENGYSIVTLFEDGSEFVALSGLTKEDAEQTLRLAGQEVRYEQKQLALDLGR